jgi:hypothetical protein
MIAEIIRRIDLEVLNVSNIMPVGAFVPTWKFSAERAM